MSNSGIEDSESGVHHQLDRVFDVFAGPRARTLSVLVFAADLARTAVSLMHGTRWVVARSPDAIQFRIAERHLVGALTGTDRRFDVGTDRRFRDPLPVDGEAEERAQDAQACSLCARTELQSRVEQVGVARCELVDHHAAATVCVCGQLFREGPILAERRGRNLRGLAVGEEDAGSVGDGDAGGSGRRIRCGYGRNGLTAPVTDGFDCCGVGAGFVPGRCAGAFALEASGERAGDEDDARAPFPAAGALLEFPRSKPPRDPICSLSDGGRRGSAPRPNSRTIARYCPTERAFQADRRYY